MIIGNRFTTKIKRVFKGGYQNSRHQSYCFLKQTLDLNIVQCKCLSKSMRKQKSGTNTRDLLICHSLHIRYKYSNLDQNKRNPFFRNTAHSFHVEYILSAPSALNPSAVKNIDWRPLDCLARLSRAPRPTSTLLDFATRACFHMHSHHALMR